MPEKSLFFNWEEFLSLAKQKVDSDEFQSWIDPLWFKETNNNTLIIGTSSSFIKSWIEANYITLLKEILSSYNPNFKNIEIIVDNFYKLNTNNKASTNKKAAAENIKEKPIGLELRKGYTFDSFITDPSNEFAYNAALQFAESSMEFNPLFLYGGVGMGKTHLLNAIGRKIKENSPEKKVVYMPAEMFTNLFISSLKNNRPDDFKHKMRSCDVLIIDDVQFLGGKVSSQEELLHTFNLLFSYDKKLVFAADKTPYELQGIDQRIKSRLSGGVTANIMATTYDLRLNFLKTKASDLKIKFPIDILEFLADNIISNIRELEGAFREIVTQHRLLHIPITMENVINLLESKLKTFNRIITLDIIQKAVSEYYNIKVSDLVSSKKDQKTSYARQVAMYLSKKLTPSSLTNIGKQYKRSHSIVSYSLEKIEESIKTNLIVSDDIRNLTKIIQQ